jgi:hypothetical protein
MPNKTKTLKEYTSTKEVLFIISELNDKFFRTHKRSSKVELVYSCRGTNKKPIHALAVWYDDVNAGEVEYFKQIIN